MTFSQEQADQHNALVQKAWALLESEMILHDRPVRKIGFLAKRRLRQAEQLFNQALKINPEGWSSMWAIGKIYQRRGKHLEAFQWFSNALELNPQQPDVAREATIAALDVGAADEAIRIGTQACAIDPQDQGLVCNLALAYLISGNIDVAKSKVQAALVACPEDPVTVHVASIIDSVASGKRPCPKTVLEISAYG